MSLLYKCIILIICFHEIINKLIPCTKGKYKIKFSSNLDNNNNNKHSDEVWDDSGDVFKNAYEHSPFVKYFM